MGATQKEELWTGGGGGGASLLSPLTGLLVTQRGLLEENWRESGCSSAV
jgi:hypothetical protein